MTHDSLSRHQINTTLDDTLIKLHTKSQVGHMVITRVIKTWNEMKNILWNTIHEQAAHPIVAIINGDPMSSLVELISSSQSSGASSDDRNAFSRADFRGVWNDPAHLKALSKSGYGQHCTFGG